MDARYLGVLRAGDKTLELLDLDNGDSLTQSCIMLRSSLGLDLITTNYLVERRSDICEAAASDEHAWLPSAVIRRGIALAFSSWDFGRSFPFLPKALGKLLHHRRSHVPAGVPPAPKAVLAL